MHLLHPHGSSVYAEEPRGIGLTLRAWEERVFQKIADRDGNIFGPGWGVLQFFNPDQDEEYRLDERTNSFSPLSDYRWYRYDEGLRLWVGSLNNQMLHVVTQLREKVPLRETFDLNFSYFREESLEANRNLILVGFEKSRLGADPFSLFLTFHARATKASVDLEVGGRYKRKAAEAMLSVAFLDLFNEVTLALDRFDEVRREEEKDFIDPPYFLRVLGAAPLPFRLRGEWYGGIGTRSLAQVIHPNDPTQDFLQRERPAYFGGLVEWHPWASAAVGVLGTFEKVAQERVAIGQNALNLTLQEKGVRVGSYLLVLLPLGSLEATLEQVSRTQDGQDPGEIAPNPPLLRDVRRRDIETLAGLEITALLGRLSAPLSPADLIVGYFLDNHRTDELPLELSGTQNRMKFRVRYRFTPEASLDAGVNFDLDQGERLFDGGSAALVALW